MIRAFKRDCSVQRRYQKVVKIASAPNIDPGRRDRMCADAVRFAGEIEVQECRHSRVLVGAAGNYAFIEMNPGSRSSRQ